MGSEMSMMPIALASEDRKILEVLAEATGKSRREVVRWALRYYAQKGPWPRTKRDRIQAIGGLDIGSVGPNYGEVS